MRTSTGLVVVITAATAFILAISAILAKADKARNPNRSTFAMITVSELLKLFFTGCVAFFRGESLVYPGVSFAGALRHASIWLIPAILYVVDNNLFFVAVDLLGPANFHLVNNLKIAITAVLFYIFLDRSLSATHFMAVGQILAVVVVVAMDDLHSRSVAFKDQFAVSSHHACCAAEASKGGVPAPVGVEATAAVSQLEAEVARQRSAATTAVSFLSSSILSSFLSFTPITHSDMVTSSLSPAPSAPTSSHALSGADGVLPFERNTLSLLANSTTHPFSAITEQSDSASSILRTVRSSHILATSSSSPSVRMRGRRASPPRPSTLPPPTVSATSATSLASSTSAAVLLASSRASTTPNPPGSLLLPPQSDFPQGVTPSALTPAALPLSTPSLHPSPSESGRLPSSSAHAGSGIAGVGTPSVGGATTPIHRWTSFAFVPAYLHSTFGTPISLRANSWCELSARLIGAASEERMVLASRSTALGVALVAAMGLLSSVANVANEHFVKRKDMRQRFYAEQAALYTIGAVLNGSCMLLWHGGTVASSKAIANIFSYSTTTLNVVAIAIGGFAVGHVLRFADNIVNVIAHAIAMFATAALGVVFLGQEVSVTWMCALVILVGAIYCYHTAPRHAGTRALLSGGGEGEEERASHGSTTRHGGVSGRERHRGGGADSGPLLRSERERGGGGGFDMFEIELESDEGGL